MRDLDSWEQAVVDECRRRLAENPSDKLAREVLEDVPNVMADKSKSFSWFEVEIDSSPVTQEQITEDANRILAQFAGIPPLPIVMKCERFFRPYPYDDDNRRAGWKLEGIRLFMVRTGLTVERIEKMSEAEMKEYA